MKYPLIVPKTVSKHCLIHTPNNTIIIIITITIVDVSICILLIFIFCIIHARTSSPEVTN